ncbi:MAG: type III-A CRISPR-associated RAMP protein Csm3 [Syntrophaceae bacterium]|nr:type III-A CRISPR-associated RAMP protein Csm3 [Syntrophaceae bacterium]
MPTQFIANIFLRGKIECLTGLHVGGSKTKFEIGGVDNPIIRDPVTRYPYIPGTSLKGKMRMLLEYHLGAVHPEGKPSEDDSITSLFGIGAEEGKNSGPVRLIVRDAYPDQTTVNLWKNLDSELLYTEYKPENTIDRLTSAANPRYMERVVKGSRFNFEMILSLYEINEKQDDAKANLDNLRQAMMKLEHSALGGSGSRGYGQIKFRVLEPVAFRKEDYVGSNELSAKPLTSIPDTEELGTEFKSLNELEFDNVLSKPNTHKA